MLFKKTTNPENEKDIVINIRKRVNNKRRFITPNPIDTMSTDNSIFIKRLSISESIFKNMYNAENPPITAAVTTLERLYLVLDINAVNRIIK